MIFVKIKAGTLEPLTHVILEKNNEKIVTSEGKENSHTSIIPGRK